MATERPVRVQSRAAAGLSLGGDDGEGATLQVRSESLQQQWLLVEQRQGENQGFMLVNSATQRALALVEGGSKVLAVTYDPEQPVESNLLWLKGPVVLENGHGYHPIQALQSSWLCLDYSGEPMEGTPVAASMWTGTANQQWELIYLDDPSTSMVYPPPRASHAEVVANRALFMETLAAFHAEMKSVLRVPQMGGKELDLHLLYQEVTSRGGLGQVIKDRRWKEVTEAFRFPPTTTSASFVVRKYYSILLHHYEQVYFLGSTGAPVPPPVPPTASPVGRPPGSGKRGTGDMKKVGRKRRVLQPAPPLIANPAALIGQTITGAIQARFEHGYFVTVNVGTEQLKGILYPPPPQNAYPYPLAMLDSTAAGIEIVKKPPPPPPPAMKKRRRRHAAEGDLAGGPPAPKQVRTAYNYYFQEWRGKIKEANPSFSDRDVIRAIGVQWQQLSEEARQKYKDMGEADRQRFDVEMQQRRAQNLEATAAGGS